MFCDVVQRRIDVEPTSCVYWSAVKGESTVEFSLTHLGFVAFKKLFLTVVFSTALKSLEKSSIHCLGGIASTELDLSFPLRVFNVTKTVLDYLLRFLVFFIFVLLPNFLVVVNDVYVFWIFL